ncbi:MAG: ATP synthase F0 subunit C [Myxococcales bacterium FL481]|nr:MAG: ATP synthase F0 subunit C [Myxococcales bacterium FL481]
MRNRILAPLATLAVLLVPSVALAADGGGASNWAYAMAVGLIMGLGIFGGGLGQGRAVAGVLEGICRNPGSKDAAFVPMILGLAFIESLVIFGMVMSFLLLNNIG